MVSPEFYAPDRHRHLIDKDEVWYEDSTDDRGEAEAIADLAIGGEAAFLC